MGNESFQNIPQITDSQGKGVSPHENLFLSVDPFQDQGSMETNNIKPMSSAWNRVRIQDLFAERMNE